MILLILGVGGGGAYIFTRPSPSPPATLTATLNAEPTTVDRGKSVTLTWNSENASDLDLEPSVGKVQPRGSVMLVPQDSTTYTLTARGDSGTQSAAARVTVSTPEVVPPVTPPVKLQPVIHEKPGKRHGGETENVAPIVPVHTVDPKQIGATITEGDLFLNRAEYNDAISAYQRGLPLDPGNTTLRDRIEKTRRAQETEQKLGTQ